MNAEEKWFNDRCKEIEAIEFRNPQLMHETIKNLSKPNICCTSGCIKKTVATLAMSKEEVLERWEEYSAKLYVDERKGRPEIRKVLDGPPITFCDMTCCRGNRPFIFVGCCTCSLI